MAKNDHEGNNLYFRSVLGHGVLHRERSQLIDPEQRLHRLTEKKMLKLHCTWTLIIQKKHVAGHSLTLGRQITLYPDFCG